MNTLYIVRGIPGSGKSSFCRKMFPNIFHVENDMFNYHNNEYLFSTRKQEFAIDWCTDMVTLAMKKGMDCVVSNTFTKRHFVDTYVNIARSFGANVKIYRMMGSFDNIHDVPKNIFENMKNNFEVYPGEIFTYPTHDGYKMYDFTIGDHVFDQKTKEEYKVSEINQYNYPEIDDVYVEDMNGRIKSKSSDILKKIDFDSEYCK